MHTRIQACAFLPPAVGTVRTIEVLSIIILGDILEFVFYYN